MSPKTLLLVGILLCNSSVLAGPWHDAETMVCAFSRKLWSQAQRRMQMPLTALQFSCGVFDNFYGIHGNKKGIEVSVCVGPKDRNPYKSVKILYLRNYKCANKFVFLNVMEHWEKVLPPGNCSAGVHKQIVFTTVRDTLTRFDSGFTEIIFRYGESGVFLNSSLPIKSTTSDLTPSSSLAKEFVKALLRGHPNWYPRASSTLIGNHHYGALAHLYSFLQPVNQFVESKKYGGQKLDIVGNTEDMDSLLSKLNQELQSKSPTLGFSLPKWRKDINGTHHNQTNAFSGNLWRASMHALLLSDKNIASAVICALYLPDIVCFNQTFPKETIAPCAAWWNEKNLSAWGDVINDARTAFCPNGVTAEPRKKCLGTPTQRCLWGGEIIPRYNYTYKTHG
eukprot:m.127458 g.127458  ORF g.127458 m.127458 type:complete len:393 (-) comp14547_c0_seq2:143-1321(-)